MSKSAYRGKYPNRVCGYAGTYYKGVYSVVTKSGGRFYVAAADCRAAGYTNSMEQLLNKDITELGFACASLHAANERQLAATIKAMGL